jgi:hypothetical protein
MNELLILQRIYRHFLALKVGTAIPVVLRAKEKVQDDPFDWWVTDEVLGALKGVPGVPQVKHAGSLTTPDLVIYQKDTHTYLGLEVKKVDSKTSGADGRGLTVDYNSCLPCGRVLIKVKGADTAISCFYLSRGLISLPSSVRLEKL